jgi:hypothetical protein
VLVALPARGGGLRLVKVATAEAEARVLNAIHDQILSPENIAYCAERTLEEIAKTRRAADPKVL